MNTIVGSTLCILTLVSAGAHAADDESILSSQLLGLRDAFVNQIKSEGFHPRLSPPAIVLDNPPSYGRYENDQNVVHIAVWSALSEEQQARFARLAKLLNNGRTPEQVFDDSVHRWIFVHELGHWWQLCQNKINANHYSVEYGANRIAAAFWRQKDPEFMRATEHRMSMTFGTLPVPLPNGQNNSTYFNENYEKLGPTPAYIWFQYSMVLGVQAESPLPTFKQALKTPVFP